MLWTHPDAFRFVLNKDCVTAFSASSQLDLPEMLVCIKVGMNLLVLLLTSVKEQFCLVGGLAEAPKLVSSDWGLSQLKAQLSGSVRWPALHVTEVLAWQDFVKLTWCWSNTLWKGVDMTCDVGQQRNDACCPFGALNYSNTVTAAYHRPVLRDTNWCGKVLALCPWLTWGRWRS